MNSALSGEHRLLFQETDQLWEPEKGPPPYLSPHFVTHKMGMVIVPHLTELL